MEKIKTIKITLFKKFNFISFSILWSESYKVIILFFSYDLPYNK